MAVSNPGLREEMLARAEYKCERCGGTSEPSARNRFGLEVHHKIPEYQGGLDEPDNLEVLCSTCHPRGRPKGTCKPPERQWKGFHLKMPEEMLEEMKRAAPPGELAEWVRQAIKEKLARDGHS